MLCKRGLLFAGLIAVANACCCGSSRGNIGPVSQSKCASWGGSYCGSCHPPCGAACSRRLLEEQGGMAVVATSAAAAVSSTHSIVHYVHKDLAIRHCDYQLFATPASTPAADFVFTFVPALNKQVSQVSLQSSNYNTKYITPITDAGVEAGRLGLRDSPDPDASSFTQVPGLADAKGGVSFKAAGGNYICLGSALSGGCAGNYHAPAADVVLADGADKAACTWMLAASPPPPTPAPPTPAPPPAAAAVTVDAEATTHTVSKWYLGCHSDSGYTHQPRGFYSQLIMDGSFEALPSGLSVFSGWNNSISAGVDASIASDADEPLDGIASRKITLFSAPASGGSAGLANRGLGNEGLYLQGGKEYDGYFFAKAPTGLVTTFEVRLEDYTNGIVLARQTISFAGGNWTRLNFTLTPTAGTECDGVEAGTDPEVDCGAMGPGVGHVCVKCAGQFVVALSQPGSANIDFVFLQPGTWGRYKGLPVLKDTVDTLLDMGVSLIRQGGSFASGPDDGAYYQWEKWRGPAWKRPSAGATWGRAMNAGWGPFEMIDMCNAAGIEPVITTTASSSPESFANLVEYCHGNASTPMGALRVHEDGHEAPYDAKIFELGNEQYNPNYVEQVAAMEEKAVQLGMGGQLKYMFPNNGKFLNDDDLAKAKKLSPRLDAQMLSDEHVGGGGGVSEARTIFQTFGDFKLGAVNAETNAGIHTMKRAMMEASDLMDWFNAADIADRLVFRTASFCTERSGHYDAFDQGISFFLPNMTWIQPPGFVHKMIHDTWQPNGVNATVQSGAGVSASAQKSEDGKVLVVRLVNDDAAPKQLTLAVHGMPVAVNVAGTTLSAPNGDLEAANPPGDLARVSPVSFGAKAAADSTVAATLAPRSFTVLVFDRA